MTVITILGVFMHLLIFGYEESPGVEQKVPERETGTILTHTPFLHVLSFRHLEPRGTPWPTELSGWQTVRISVAQGLCCTCFWPFHGLQPSWWCCFYDPPLLMAKPLNLPKPSPFLGWDPNELPCAAQNLFQQTQLEKREELLRQWLHYHW